MWGCWLVEEFVKWVVVEGEGEGDNQTTENQTALMMQGFSVPEGRFFFSPTAIICEKAKLEIEPDINLVHTPSLTQTFSLSLREANSERKPST